ncbi:MAG TPA: Nre family DNA repair protein [Methanotrichaceae archaeon]|nr:Nre family DNA repair protein [Methanotrichaceae archaeon]
MKCVTCKGRGLCGRPVCPILRRLEEISALPKIGKRMEGISPPEVFVGRQGYPMVRAGPMLPASETVAQPSLGMDIGEIIALRSSLVRSEARMGVKEASIPGRLLESCQQMAMSSAPVGAEVAFFKPPKGKLQFDGVLSPSGPSAEMKGMEITTNPLIPRKVDQVVADKDVLAADAVGELYSSGIDTGHISRLLSLGLLGKRRKLVPTRWSITASDDMAGKALKDKVVDRPIISDFQLYSGEDLGNHFEILLLPRAYSFELIEIWMSGSLWAPDGWIGSDGEGLRDRKEYSSLAGGYYAARLAVLEHLARQGRQASALAVREISEDYWAPLGVWVVRDVARKALSEVPKIFSTLDDVMDEMGRRLKTPRSKWNSCSHLTSGQFQSSLANFF